MLQIEPQTLARRLVRLYVEHGDRIARRLRPVVFLFLGAWLVGLVVAPFVFRLLILPSVTVVAFNLTDGLAMLIRVAALFAAAVTFPAFVFAVFRLLREIFLPPDPKTPHPGESDAGGGPSGTDRLPGLPFSIRTTWLIASGLFLAGLAFAGLGLFPLILRFILRLSGQLDITPLFGAAEYFSFLVGLALPIALFFELPLVLVVLVSANVVRLEVLKRIRKYVYFFLYVIASMITPPDVLTHILAALPLIALYELGLFFAARLKRP
ncbi:MAG: twin-arginine translocase subunit TatC [Hydrogenibacillus schlegelii]|nr:twin-arginine translocase subunit TatC [Hydrogenibacillus schlegelii]